MKAFSLNQKVHNLRSLTSDVHQVENSPNMHCELLLERQTSRKIIKLITIAPLHILMQTKIIFNGEFADGRVDKPKIES